MRLVDAEFAQEIAQLDALPEFLFLALLLRRRPDVAVESIRHHRHDGEDVRPEDADVVHHRPHVPVDISQARTADPGHDVRIDFRGMVHGQDAHRSIPLVVGLDHVHAVDHVRRQVGIGQDHALVRAGRAGGKQDFRRGVEVKLQATIHAPVLASTPFSDKFFIAKYTLYLTVDGNQSL